MSFRLLSQLSNHPSSFTLEMLSSGFHTIRIYLNLNGLQSLPSFLEEFCPVILNYIMPVIPVILISMYVYEPPSALASYFFDMALHSISDTLP